LKKSDDGGVGAVVVATGIASMAVQLVFVREYLAQFQGNEIVIALIFFCWLVLGGIGTAAAKGPGLKLVLPTPSNLAMLSGLLALLSACQVVAIRWLRDPIFTHGSSVGFYGTFGYIAGTIAPYALLVGFVLPYSLMVARRQLPDYPGNWIYMADNAGDVTGAALFSFVLADALSDPAGGASAPAGRHFAVAVNPFNADSGRLDGADRAGGRGRV